ncbi:MAG: hypothetical protein MUC87_18980 [Bacteroidia bacterium]|jgi:hypothetical protein|nr:hypothetical protein [Bacteroidia bacterium]
MTTQIHKFNPAHNLFYLLISFILIGLSGALIFAIDYKPKFIVLAILLCIIGLTGIFFHLLYFFHDYGKYMEVDYANKTIIIHRKFEKTRLPFSEINEIQRRTGKKSTHIPGGLVFHQYHHTRLLMKNGSRYVFTDFLTDTVPHLPAKHTTRLSLFNIIVK